MDFGAQISNLVGLGKGFIAGDGFIGAFGGISMRATSMAGLHPIALEWGPIVLEPIRSVKWKKKYLDFAQSTDFAGARLTIDSDGGLLFAVGPRGRWRRR